MPLPNINSVQQAGVDPLDIQTRKNIDQHISEILDSIQSRLSNITNMRSNIQTATFDAFGNNFVSRSLSQGMDSLVDSFSSLITGKKEEKDPVLDNQKEQTRLLNNLVNIAGETYKTLDQIDDSVINVRRDIKNIFDKSSAENDNTLSPITPISSTGTVSDLTSFPEITLTDTSNDEINNTKPEVDISSNADKLKIDETDDVFSTLKDSIYQNIESIDISINALDDNTDALDDNTDTLDKVSKEISDLLKNSNNITPTSEVVNSNARREKNDNPVLSIENNPSPVLDFPLPADKEHVIIQPSESSSTSNFSSKVDNEPKQSKTKHDVHEEHVEQILTDILHTMTHTNDSIDKLLSVVPISSQEDDLEKQQTVKNNQTLSSKIKDPSQVEDAPPGSNKFDWSRLVTGWFDMDANIRGINNILKGIGNAASKIGEILPRSLGSLIPSASTIGAGLAAAAPMAAMYGVTKWAESASITDDTGELTNTGKVLDTVQTSLGGQSLKPQTSIMSNVDRINQEADTGFFDFFGTKKEAFRKKYQEQIDRQQTFSKEEADALKKNFDINVPEKQITQTASSIELKKSESNKIELLDQKQKELTDTKQKDKTTASGVNVHNNSVVNNQTIMPSRSSTKNMDDSYNRYMTRVMS